MNGFILISQIFVFLQTLYGFMNRFKYVPVNYITKRIGVFDVGRNNTLINNQ